MDKDWDSWCVNYIFREIWKSSVNKERSYWRKHYRRLKRKWELLNG